MLKKFLQSSEIISVKYKVKQKISQNKYNMDLPLYRYFAMGAFVGFFI